jgi:FkbM family methyltransferase
MLDHMSRFLAYDASFDAEEIIRRHAVEGVKPNAELVTNFIGVLMEPLLFPPLLDNLVGQVEGPPIPANWHADVAEWAAVFRAIELAGEDFSIVELGCAWGCWMCNAGTAAKRSGRTVNLIGVEAVQEFVSTALRHLKINDFLESEFTLHLGVAAASGGRALFPKKAAEAVNFGLAPVFNPSERELIDILNAGTHDLVEIIPISEILANTKRVDLLHIDIQGGEFDLLKQNIEIISEKIAYVFVGTHSREIEGKIFELMLHHGFMLEVERPAILTLHRGSNPSIRYDGAQGWRNSRF